MPQPLIMDDNVIAALKAVTSEPSEASAADYVRYLDTAADWAFEFGVTRRRRRAAPISAWGVAERSAAISL